MASPCAEKAINDALENGHALLKFISRNDVGDTGGHQCGFYLPRSAWKIFSPQSPIKGKNHKHPVQVIWQDGLTTYSVVTWYGVGTRSEYRLTRFGRGFPWLNSDSVGNLLVIVPISLEKFLAYVLDLEDDIETVQSALGVQIFNNWGIYDLKATPIQETENECIERHFREFAGSISKFPLSDAFSQATRRAIMECIKNYPTLSPDERLMKFLSGEYQLFRMAERKLCQSEIIRVFKDIEDFLSTAASIMNRRKSRAGLSLENHVEYLFKEAGIPFDRQPKVDGDIKPDILIPSKAAYDNPSYPVNRLFVLGLKTTCKDRWRQVLSEGKRIPEKHILTTQVGISSNQLREMSHSKVTLIVPQPLHKEYPKDTSIKLLTLNQFIQSTKQLLK